MRNVGALVGGLVLVVAVALNNPVAVVDEGHVGLITELGRAKELRGPGVTLINPFIQDLKEVETRVLNNFSQAGKAVGDDLFRPAGFGERIGGTDPMSPQFEPTARMIATELFSSCMLLTKDESILILSNGKLRR